MTHDVICFNAAVSACAKGGQWVSTFALLDKMRKQGMPSGQPVGAGIGLAWGMRMTSVMHNVVSFGAAISACEKASQWKQASALKVLQQE